MKDSIDVDEPEGMEVLLTNCSLFPYLYVINWVNYSPLKDALITLLPPPCYTLVYIRLNKPRRNVLSL